MADARTLAPGRAVGTALVLDAPLSFWGGIETATGRITDVHHPQLDAVVTGCILVLPSGRGSSSSSAVLAETIRLGTGPAAIVLAEPDPILALAAIVAGELYGATIPVVVADAATYRAIADGGGGGGEGHQHPPPRDG
ncbi:MAG: aconitase X swivel domain-containing protein, partial [Actinomycetota bacterium]